MTYTIGIRREDKNQWEKRTPIVPKHANELVKDYNINVLVQPSPIRVFKDKEYENAGAKISEDLSGASVIFAVKEIPLELFLKNKTYAFFSHTIKGQDYNMPMLREMMKLDCNLIDYEKIVDIRGRRLVFFGRFAGLAGMVDTLWALGERVRWQGFKTPFFKIHKTVDYDGLNDVKKHIVSIGKKIEKNGLPEELTPLIIGFAGYGNVSNGAQEILDLLPVREIRPAQIESVLHNPSNKCIYKVVFKEEDMVTPVSSKKDFDLQDYYKHPENYTSIFENYLPFLTVLMNAIYWDERYPRLITKKYLKEKIAEEDFKLKVIGDISVDVAGAVEFTLKTTTPANPVFVYNPLNDDFEDGFTSEGIVVMAVDNLPCELPRESSKAFSETLKDFIPSIAKADYAVSYDKIDLPSEIKNALILHKGKLTPNYKYINKFL